MIPKCRSAPSSPCSHAVWRSCMMPIGTAAQPALRISKPLLRGLATPRSDWCGGGVCLADFGQLDSVPAAFWQAQAGFVPVMPSRPNSMKFQEHTINLACPGVERIRHIQRSSP